MLATAGEGYAYYIERSWQITFDSPALLRTGNTITVGGERVAMLPTGYSGKPEEHTCNVAAGRSIYVDGIGDECSTIHGDHARFGTTDSDRTRCPRAMYVGGHASGTASIDGRPVANQGKTIVATGVYAVHVPKNIFGTKRRSGRSAVYGEAVLLSGSSRGTHVIHLTGSSARCGRCQRHGRTRLVWSRRQAPSPPAIRWCDRRSIRFAGRATRPAP